MHFDSMSPQAAAEGEPGARPVRETQAAIRLRPPPPLVDALQHARGPRKARCRLLRGLPHRCSGGRRSRLVLFALMQALGDRDPEVCVAALDGLHALAVGAPRMRGRAMALLALASAAPARSVAMHAAMVLASLAGEGGGDAIR